MAPVTPAPGYYYTRGSLAWFWLVAAVVLFIIGAFAFGDHPLAGIPGWTWDSAAFAACVLSRVVP